MYPDNLTIEPTKRSPWIVLEHGRIFIMGRSIIENPSVFYGPVHKWIAEHARAMQGKTKIELGFDFINSGSTKWLYILLRELAGMEDLKQKASVFWYYEEGDEDMHELGRIIKSLIECPFRLIQVSNMDDRFYRTLFSKAL